jgi:N-acetylmuramoyl-L-alanine amidase
VFFDLKNVQATPELRDAVLRYTQDAVRQIRIGRHPESTVRVVLDLEGIRKYSVFTLYNPFRLVVDCEPLAPTSVAASIKTVAPPLVIAEPEPRLIVDRGPVVEKPVPPPATPARSSPVTSSPAAASAAPPPAPLAAAPTVEGSPPPAPAPIAPKANVAGGYSLSRQLGLGITRIVIDPGHGGHDPGAQGKGLNEADLTLDVALRVEKLLVDEGLEVVLTRREDSYIPLEERTAMANRENADLFLSIHANASRNATASGVETYFLSFAATSEAEAVAARENSSSAGGMHNLPDIIKAIALNNKLDESRDFAGMVQEALVSRLRRSNKDVRNLGVKKAPFVVLIGAGMPSVLAEISFLTNRQELALLKTAAYKQRVAEALHAAVMRYRRSLKGQGQVAEQ